LMLLFSLVRRRIIRILYEFLNAKVRHNLLRRSCVSYG